MDNIGTGEAALFRRLCSSFTMRIANFLMQRILNYTSWYCVSSINFVKLSFQRDLSRNSFRLSVYLFANILLTSVGSLMILRLILLQMSIVYKCPTRRELRHGKCRSLSLL